jgi:hypothetical protein
MSDHRPNRRAVRRPVQVRGAIWHLHDDRGPVVLFAWAPAMSVLAEQAFVTPTSRSAMRKFHRRRVEPPLSVGVRPVERRDRGAAGRCPSADGQALR